MFYLTIRETIKNLWNFQNQTFENSTLLKKTLPRVVVFVTAGELGPEVGAGVGPGFEPVPGEGVHDPDEGGGEYTRPAAALPPDN